MIKIFIKDILKIYNFKTKLFNSGKDNITYEIIPNSGESFIIQQMLSKKTEKNLEFIEKIVNFINKNSNTIKFAGKYGKKRFIKYENNLFQLMEKLTGKTITEKNIDIDIIKKTAIFIANFHKITDKFDFLKYNEINYFKKMHNYRLEIKKQLKYGKTTQPGITSIKSEKINTYLKIQKIYEKMNNISKDLKENHDLPKGIIHGDPSFKNYIIDNSNNIVGLIDYDMLSVNTILWDLVDLIRSYMKIESFNKKEFEILINSYNKERKISKLEQKELKNYCKMMILDTGFRYLLSAFESNENKNLLGDKNDSLKKANRCLLEIEKLNTFYK